MDSCPVCEWEPAYYNADGTPANNYICCPVCGYPEAEINFNDEEQ